MKLQLAAAFALVILAGPAAHAFTVDDKSNTTSTGGARYTDPDAQFSRLELRQRHYRPAGQYHLPIRRQPGSGSFNQRYDWNRMFDTLGGPGRNGYLAEGASMSKPLIFTISRRLGRRRVRLEWSL